MKRRKFIKNSSILFSGMALSVQKPLIEYDKNKIIPRSLKKGDTVAISAPAGAVFSSSYIDKFVEILQSYGFKVIEGQTLKMQEGYLAGSDEARAKELNYFFRSDEVKAIFMMRGGWGCARILDSLDFNILKTKPKIIIGYSDITSLLIAITKRTGLVTYHGLMGYSTWEPYSTLIFESIVMSGNKVLFQNHKSKIADTKTLTKGKAEGELIGGNLSVIASIIGTKYEPNWNNKILFLEEIGEEPYRIDRLLWQLKLAGVFNKINGLVLGSFKNCKPEKPSISFSLNSVFNQHFLNFGKPVYMGANFGHSYYKFTLPIGIKAKLNADNHSIELMESPTLF